MAQYYIDNDKDSIRNYLKNRNMYYKSDSNDMIKYYYKLASKYNTQGIDGNKTISGNNDISQNNLEKKEDKDNHTIYYYKNESPYYVYKTTKYDSYINKYAKENKVDPLLIKAVISQESNFKEDAVSANQARGLMQITPIAVEELKNKNINIVDIYDANENIYAGTKLYSDLLKKHKDIEMAILEYHQGAGNIKKLINKAGSNRWKDVKTFAENNGYIKEGLKYVDRVMKYYKLYKNNT